MIPKNSVLITGCSGFIGKAIARAAVVQGYEVTGLCFGHHIKDDTNDSVNYIYADISDSKSLDQAIKTQQFDYVINCAGYIDHQSFLNDKGRKLIDSHFIGLINLVQCIHHENLKGFVQIGSSDEYGNNVSPQNEKLREQPISPYSFAKTASTYFLQMLYQTESFPATIARLFLVYGPGQNHRRFIPQIISGCLDGACFPVSKGEQLRDFCYIDDVAEGVLKLLTSEKARGEVVNIASGKPIAIKEVINLIRHKIGHGKPQFGEVAYRSGENMSLHADISKITALTNWRPSTDLNTGLDCTIDWFSNR